MEDAAPRPLEGIRVLDFTRVFAGPAATQMLGDLGAEVIKVEEPGRGDEARTLGTTPASLAQLGASASFLAFNRNKKSIALDLRSPVGLEVARSLARQVDVVVHNFRPGAMARWRLDWESLRADNPKLIHCSFSAYGETGPLRDVGANDLALQGHSGLMSITGEPDRPPVRCGSAVIDLHGGMAMVSAILAALLQRAKTGRGQAVETSLLRASAHLMSYLYTEYWLDGTVRRPMGTANHLSVPNQVVPTADGSVVIIAPSDEMWRRCARALDPATLDRPDFATAMDRRLRREEVIGALAAVTGRMTSDAVVAALAAAKVNVAKVNSVGQAADDAQLDAIGGRLDLVYRGQSVRTVAAPFAMSGRNSVPIQPRCCMRPDTMTTPSRICVSEAHSGRRRRPRRDRPAVRMTCAPLLV
jgi:crotonobetainyl-CoA:carnitine CoA-transferase CaiB-like acyl-CoA transferase